MAMFCAQRRAPASRHCVRRLSHTTAPPQNVWYLLPEQPHQPPLAVRVRDGLAYKAKVGQRATAACDPVQPLHKLQACRLDKCSRQGAACWPCALMSSTPHNLALVASAPVKNKPAPCRRARRAMVPAEKSERDSTVGVSTMRATSPVFSAATPLGRPSCTAAETATLARLAGLLLCCCCCSGCRCRQRRERRRRQPGCRPSASCLAVLLGHCQVDIYSCKPPHVAPLVAGGRSQGPFRACSTDGAAGAAEIVCNSTCADPTSSARLQGSLPGKRCSICSHACC